MIWGTPHFFHLLNNKGPEDDHGSLNIKKLFKNKQKNKTPKKMETKIMKKHSKPKKKKKTQLFTTIAMLCWGCGRFAIFVKNFGFFVVVFVFVFECFFIICCFHPFSFFVFF